MVERDAIESKAIELAIGRILRLASRPARPGDVHEYFRCRDLIEDLTPPVKPAYQFNRARDRNKGAQGD